MTFVVHRDAQGQVTISGSASSEGLSVSFNSVVASFTDDQVAPAADTAAPAEPAVPAEPVTAVAEPAAAAAETQAAGSETAAPPAAAPEAPYKCPQCGAGYDGPGTCSNQHPPVEVVPIAEQAAAASTSTSTTAGTEAGGPVWPDGTDQPQP